jgi:hypothetical protein
MPIWSDGTENIASTEVATNLIYFTTVSEYIH